jgi:hypothetical protein
VPVRQIVLDAMAEGLPLNYTHEAVLRFLRPYAALEKDVDAAVKIPGKVFAKVKPRLDSGRASRRGRVGRFRWARPAWTDAKRQRRQVRCRTGHPFDRGPSSDTPAAESQPIEQQVQPVAHRAGRRTA